MFAEDRREESIRAIRAAFETKPVHFLIWVRSMREVPRPLFEFWIENYHQYWGQVWIAGRLIAGRAGESVEVPFVVRGNYRFFPGRSSPASRIRVGSHEISGGDTILLAAGPARIELLDDLDRGYLLLAVSEPPAPPREHWYPQVLPDEVMGHW